MNANFERLMKDAVRLTELTRSGDLHAATAAIQAALSANLPNGGQPFASPGASHPQVNPLFGSDTTVIDVESREVPGDGTETPAARPSAPASQPVTTTEAGNAEGQFIAGSYADASSRRDFKLYIPPGTHSKPLPLVVMLHGCTQSPDDFAAGTAMNQIAAQQGFYVLYPAQSQQANPQRCWNWFKHSHQARGRGEPALIAGMTRDVMSRYPVDANRVYVAGLSAGGAMADIMAMAYPELYAAAGVHSGLAAGVASDLPSALAAMSGGPAKSRGTAQKMATKPVGSVPTIVFHGDRDSTVHPGNGDQVIAALTGDGTSVETENVESPTGRSSIRRVYRSADGQTVAEHWVVQGAPHAWSGGSSQGSYTDPRGPDASVEMMRFFMAHGRRKTA